MLKAIVRTLLRWLFRVEVRGSVPDPLPERLLVIANHQSLLDGVVLGAFLPFDPVFVVHTSVMKLWYFRLIMRHLPHLVVDSANPMAVKSMVRLIEQGRPVVIFPEGRLTATGSLMKIYEGPAFVAAKTGATVLPVGLDGPSRSFFSRLRSPGRRRLFPKLTLTIQPTTRIQLPEGGTAKQRRRQAAEDVRRVMQEMMFACRRPQTLFTAFLDVMAHEGRGRLVLEDVRQGEMSYGQILKASLALGRLVSKLTREGERVGVLLPNVGSTVSLLLGVTAFRRVPAMLNYTAGLDGLRSACATAELRVVLTSRAFLQAAKLEETVAKLDGVQVVCLEDLRARFTLGDKLWLMAFALWFPRRATRTVSADEPAVVLFTSGSEGKPKGVVLAHRSVLANIAQIKSVVDLGASDKILNALPLFHSFGLTAGTLMPLLTGSKLFLYPSPLHYRVIPEIVYDRGCTMLFGTNTFLSRYAQCAHPYDFFTLRYVVAGAEKLSEDVRRLWMDKFGIRIFEGYGATECAPVLAVNTPMAYKPGTVGPLLPGVEHQLVPVPGIDRGGILHVRGANLMMGYLLPDKPGVLQPPSSEVGEHWYNTGDVVEVDDHGFVRIQGRVKRFAKVAGEMVSLEVVEKVASLASPQFQHAATTQTDAQRGELIVLFTEDPDLRRSQLQTAAQQAGAPELAIPRRVTHVAQLPLLGTGKRDYVALKRMAEAGVEAVGA